MRTFNINDPAPQHNPFIVPDGYFQQFTASMMLRIKNTPASPRIAELPVVRWIPLLGAACVTGLIALFTCIDSPSMPNPAETSAASTTNTAQGSEDIVYDYLMMADANMMTAYEKDY